MEIIKLNDDIFCINNFLSEKSANSFKEMCKEYKGRFRYEDIHVPQRGIYPVGADIPVQYAEAWDEYYKRINTLFNKDTYFPIYTKTLYEFKPFDKNLNHNEIFSLGPHFDDYGNRNENGYLNFEEQVILHGYIYYINDEYEGGGLDYINKNFYVKPQANSLIWHPGTEEYTHQVLQSHGCERYTIPGFLKNIKLKKDNF